MVPTPKTGPSEPASPSGAALPLASIVARLDPVRIAGFTLYSTWMLVTFYNTLLLTGTSDIKGTLYLNMLLSMLSLALTLVMLPRLSRNADKRVLSKTWTWGSGGLMAISTMLLVFADSASLTGSVITVTSAVLTGFSSGVLLLGWYRLFTDLGPRQAMAEMAIGFSAAALVDILLTLIPPIIALPLVAVAALGSALILRRCAFNRPDRPKPAREHQLRPRTRRMFARGLVAIALIGMVAGFLDVLAGFRYVPVPDRYEILQALGILIAGIVLFAIAALARDSFVTASRRVVLAGLVLGCLLTIFIERMPGLPEVVVLGAYQVGLGVTLAVICIDISNYFDQPATRAFGYAFGATYLGETVGNGLAHFMGLGLGVTTVDIATAAFILSAVVVLATTFLFTEGDLVETSVGEMTDDDRDLPGASGMGNLLGTYAMQGAAPAGAAGRALAAGEDDAEGAAATIDGDGAGPDGPSLGEAQQTPDAPVAQRRDIEQIAAELSSEFGLTPRESAVLPLILRGRTLARIQEELCISQGTAGTHTRHIYQKIGVHNRQALIDMLEERLHGE